MIEFLVGRNRLLYSQLGHVGLHWLSGPGSRIEVIRPARCRTWACTGSVDQATAVVRRPARCRTWACTGSVDQATAVVRRPARCRTWACTRPPQGSGGPRGAARGPAPARWTRPPQWSGGPRGAARGPAPGHRKGQAARAVPHVGLHQATARVRRSARCRTWACTRPPQGSGGPRGAARGPAPGHRSGQAARAVPHVGLHQATAVVRRPARCRTWACTRPPQGSGGPRGAASLYAALLRYIQKLLNCGAARRRLGLIKVVGGSLVI